MLVLGIAKAPEAAGQLLVDLPRCSAAAVRVILAVC
jgi:hypothetical protein